jgi:hypothetical protein
MEEDFFLLATISTTSLQYFTGRFYNIVRGTLQ